MHMFWTLYCRKTPNSLISNEMVSEMYKHKISYINQTVDAYENNEATHNTSKNTFSDNEIKNYKRERRCLKL